MSFAFVSVMKILVKNACQSFAEKRSAHILLKTAQHLLDLILSVKEMIGKKTSHRYNSCYKLLIVRLITGLSDCRNTKIIRFA